MNAQDWADAADASDLLLLVAEGPYVRFGMPADVTIRRHADGYEIEWVEAGDGASVPAQGKRNVDRAGLVAFLEQLLEGGRPVRRIA